MTTLHHARRAFGRPGIAPRWTRDEWAAAEDTPSTPTAVGIEFVDIPIGPGQSAPIRFTFFWPEVERWEGRDFQVFVEGA